MIVSSHGDTVSLDCLLSYSVLHPSAKYMTQEAAAGNVERIDVRRRRHLMLRLKAYTPISMSTVQSMVAQQHRMDEGRERNE